MTGYVRGEADFAAADRFRREPRSASSLAPKDYSVPLHVDCSIEYELPDCAKPPQGVKIEPLLMIHPSHFRRLESLRRVPFVNNLPRSENPASGRTVRARPVRRCCRSGTGTGVAAGAGPHPAAAPVPAPAAPHAARYRLLLDELLAEPAPAPAPPAFRFDSFPMPDATMTLPEFAECGPAGGKAAMVVSRRPKPHPYLTERTAHYERFDERRALQQLPIYM